MSTHASPRRLVAAAGIAGLAVAASLGAAPQASALAGLETGPVQQSLAQIAQGGEAGAYLEQESPYTELRNVYSNPQAGYSLLVDAGTFTVVEPEQDGGAVWFARDPGSDVERFSVYYNPDWNGENPPLEEYFEECAFSGQMEHQGCQILTSGTYETFELAGVVMAALVYTYPSADGDVIERVVLAEPRSDGIVYWSASYSQTSDDDSTLEGLLNAIATFAPSSDYYGGSVMWCTPESLLTRAPALQDAAAPVQRQAAQPQAGGADAPAPAAAAATENLELVQYDGGFFTIIIPQGWEVTTSGYGASCSIEAYDPADPATRIVYWGEVPFHVSALFKQMCEEYAQMGGEMGQLYAYYSALPLLEQYTMASAVDQIDDLCRGMVGIGAQYAPNSFVASDVQVTSSVPVSYMSALYGSMFADEALVGATVTLMDGTVCYADFLGSLAVLGDPGYMGMASATCVWATVAPVERYDAVAPVLAQCVGTLRFSQDYIDEAIRNGEIATENALAYSQAMDAVMSKSTQDFCDYIIGRDRYDFSDGSTLLVYYE